MCELLALSANTPTDLRFSFHGLRLRGGCTGDHVDGWGLASYDPDGLGVQLYREDAPAAFSPIAAAVAELDLRAHCSIAHIRKATRGVVALENCHPFHRRWRDRERIFAHNGDLTHLPPLTGGHRPHGQTDSEAAFCWILEELERQAIPADHEAALFEALVACSDRLAANGIFNGLLSNGAWLFAYAGTKLNRITRRAPFGLVRLADDDLSVDFAAVTQPSDVVTIVSTEPLTTEATWQSMEVGEAVLLRGGEVVRHRPGHGRQANSGFHPIVARTTVD
jgi:glutamine amidotransferase